MRKVISLVIIIILTLISTTIYATNIPVVSAKIEKTNITIEIGQTEKIVVTFTPGNATNKQINWSSSNSSVATVNKSGEVIGKASGVATIKGTVVEGGQTLTATVSVSGSSSIVSEKYSIIKKENSLGEEVKYITKIDKKTSVNDFKNNVTTFSTMKIYDLANKEIPNLDYVFTGAKLKLSDNSEYTLVVPGDLSSEGNISVLDLSRLKIKLVGLSTLDDYQMEAADLNFDGKVTITDISILKMYLVGLKQNF